MNVVGFVLFAQLTVFLAADTKPVTVARIGSATITTVDVDFLAMQMGLSADERSQMEPKLIDQLIERQLIRGFLAAKKIEPIADDLQYQMSRAEELVRKRGDDPKTLLPKLGYTPERLKRELGLPLAWQVYVRQAVKPEQIKEHYAQHKQELDGTQLRASQIFLKLSKPPSDSDLAAKKEKLAEIRRNILAGKITFADAAKQYSESPTSENGGDVGLFGWRGKLPAQVSEAAFALKVDEISEPVVSSFGVHLIQVTQRVPGDLSLEDVRSEIVERFSQELWKTTVESERAKVKIERK